MILQFIKLRSSLSEEELLKKAKQRADQFRAVPGLMQKYYVKLDQEQYGGVYVWDSAESLIAFKASDLAKSIPEAYEVKEPPIIDLMDILFQLME